MRSSKTLNSNNSSKQSRMTKSVTHSTHSAWKRNGWNFSDQEPKDHNWTQIECWRTQSQIAKANTSMTSCWQWMISRSSGPSTFSPGVHSLIPTLRLETEQSSLSHRTFSMESLSSRKETLLSLTHRWWTVTLTSSTPIQETLGSASLSRSFIRLQTSDCYSIPLTSTYTSNMRRQFVSQNSLYPTSSTTLTTIRHLRSLSLSNSCRITKSTINLSSKA